MQRVSEMAGSAAGVVDLLAPMDAGLFQTYHDALAQSLLGRMEGAVKIVPDVGDAVGKGVVASRGVTAGTRIFTEPPLVRPQHHATHPDRARMLSEKCAPCRGRCFALSAHSCRFLVEAFWLQHASVLAGG